MQFQIGMGFSRPAHAASGPVTPAAPFSAVNADGWTVTYPSPPAIDPMGAPVPVPLSRAGFAAGGVPTTHTDTLTLTKRVRLPYPNQAVLSASTVALSDYVYATDSIAGVTNLSVAVSPKPIANWVMTDRRVVGDMVTLEVVAFHRNARGGDQVACIEFSATDGTATVTTLVNASSVSPRPSDRNAVVVYRCDLDVSTLANPAVITCNAKVYPWIGSAASVRDSAASGIARGFSPRVFVRNTARHATPPLAYVATGGNDTTGVVSTAPATASAQPFATVLGAIKGLKAQSAMTGGRIDGCEVRLGAGTFLAGSLSSADILGGIQDNAALTITRDPNVAKSAAILTFGAAAFRTRFPYLRIADCTIQRTGTLAFQGETTLPMQLVLDDIVFDNNAHNASILNSTALYVYGCDLRNAGSSPLSAAANEVRLVRGLLNVSGAAIENWLVVGCALSGGAHGTTQFSAGTRSSNGAICAFNTFSGYRVIYGGLQEVVSCAVVQNVIEYFSATSNTGIGASADSAPASLMHAVIFHNTVAGFWNHGRTNAFYDETPTIARSHSLMASKGNIHVSVNTKGDVFLLDGTRTGNWPYSYGVGVAGEFHQFDAASASFRQEFAGLGSIVGTGTTTPLSPQFLAPAHTVSSTVAGAGGGNYRIAPASPAKGLVGESVLRFDLSGSARPVTGSASGAYE